MRSIRNQVVVENRYWIISSAPMPPVADCKGNGKYQRLRQKFPYWAPKKIGVNFAPRRQLPLHLQQIFGGRAAKQFTGTALRCFSDHSVCKIEHRRYDQS